MKRALAIVLAVCALGALAAFGPFGGGGSTYQVRAYFDNGDFVVAGEDVRVAGAKVGSVVGESVALPGEAVHRNGTPDPGKAAIVLQIDEAGFQDFRRDASCVIRPQSLLGEKYVDCTPTKPRAPGSPLPPPLKVIPSGQPGAGERFLPLENNGHIVDIDLVQNIQRLPYAERFRLILNELGAGVAGRGDTLNAVIKRRFATPTRSSTSSPARTTSSPTSPAIPPSTWPRSPASAATCRASSPTPASPHRRRPSAAPTSRPASRSSRTS